MDLREGNIAENKILEEINNYDNNEYDKMDYDKIDYDERDNDEREIIESARNQISISQNKLKIKQAENIKNDILKDMYKQLNDYKLMMKNTTYVTQKVGNDIKDEIIPSHMPLNYTPHGYFDLILSKSNKSKAIIKAPKFGFESKNSLFETKSLKNIKLEPLQERFSTIASDPNFKLSSFAISESTSSNRNGKFKHGISSKKFNLSKKLLSSNILTNNVSSSSQLSTKESIKMLDKRVITEDSIVLPLENDELNEKKIIKNINKLQIRFPIGYK